jgi:hypothetical protein
MTTKWKSLTTALALGAAAAGCDVPPEADKPTKSGSEVGLNEGDQMPNVLARLEIGSSKVFFAEPAPGTIIVAEDAQGQPVLTPGLPNDMGAIWKAIAQGREMPQALKEALVRSHQLAKQNPAVAPAKAEARTAVVQNTEEDAQPALDLGPGVLASTRGASQDPTDFIAYYCSNYAYAASIREACWTNRTTQNTSLTPFSIDGDVHFARAAVAAYRGKFRFVPEWRSFFSWSTLWDVWNEEGHSSSYWVSRSYPSFGYRYSMISTVGDGFHFMHWVDGSAVDGWGLGTHRIPNNI